MQAMTDTEATLFESLRPRLKAISTRIVGSEAEADDIVQDCFFKWHAADRGALATPLAWLTTVVQHQSIDRLRCRMRDAMAASVAAQLAPAAPPVVPEEMLLRRADLAAALGRLLACLSPSERLALVLHEAFDCQHADIAAVLGTTPVNARQHLARARRRLCNGAVSAAPDQKLCRDMILRFQRALDGVDLPAMVALLAHEQPVFVHASPSPRLRVRACANDLSYRCTLAA